ncbi:hypothetical protein NC651_022261, partial [Populus alba x Populus x berolinensis]
IKGEGEWMSKNLDAFLISSLLSVLAITMQIEIYPSRQSSSRSFPEPIELVPSERSCHLSLAAVSAAAAERFSKAFHEVHRKLWWVAPGGVMAQSNFNPQQLSVRYM